MREKDYYGAIKGFCLKWNLPEVWNSDRITGANLIYEVIKVINALIKELRDYEDRVDGKLEDMLKMIEDFLKMFNEDLSETVLNILIQWKESGELEEIINEALFNQKLDKSVFESFKETYDQTMENVVNQFDEIKDNLDLINEVIVNVKSYGAKGDGVTDDSLAIQKCINENDRVFFPKGEYITTVPLYMNRSGIVLEGESVNKVLIKKTTNNKLNLNITGRNDTNSDTHDSILCTLDYYGDFTITGIRFEGAGQLKNEYGLYFPYTFRFNIEDIYVTNVDEGIRLLQGWNNNIKKTRIVRCGYGIRIEGKNTDPEQSTSINFDNTFTESCDFGYKFVNLTYFSGNSMSTDFIKECAFWFEFSSGSISGVGNEYSESQFVRSWNSTIELNGVFIIGIKNRYGRNRFAKTNAKFEVVNSNRSNIGLTVNNMEIRSTSNPVLGDSTSYELSGGGFLYIFGARDNSLNAMTKQSMSTVNTDVKYNIFKRITSGSETSYGGAITHDDMYLSKVITTYNTNHNSPIQQGLVVSRMIPESNDTIVIPLSSLKTVFPSFGSTDGFISGRYKLSIYSNSQGVDDLFINGRNLVKTYAKTFGSLTVDSITFTETDLILNLSRSANYIQAYIVRS